MTSPTVTGTTACATALTVREGAVGAKDRETRRDRGPGHFVAERWFRGVTERASVLERCRYLLDLGLGEPGAIGHDRDRSQRLP